MLDGEGGLVDGRMKTFVQVGQLDSVADHERIMLEKNKRVDCEENVVRCGVRDWGRLTGNIAANFSYARVGKYLGKAKGYSWMWGVRSSVNRQKR